MAYLKKTDLQNGILTYRRRKTGQELTIKWEKCMAEIIAKYPENKIDILLPIIKEQGNERRQYDNALHLTRLLRTYSIFPYQAYTPNRPYVPCPLDFLSLRLGALSEKKNPPSVK